MDRVDKLWKLASRFDVAMLVTRDGDAMRARPLALNLDQSAGQFRFLTRASAHKVQEAMDNNMVCITMADPSANLFLSVSGQAEISRDRKLIGQLWDETAAAWFESGPDDPDVAVLTVRPHTAEYWEGGGSAIGKAWQLAAGAFGT